MDAGMEQRARTRRRGAMAALAGLLLAGHGCASGVGTTAASFLNRVRESNDPNLRHAAYAKLADPNCYDDDEQRAEAARELAARLNARREPLVTRAVICRTLGELKRPEGREALRRACDEPEPILRAAACRALGRIGNQEDALVLARVMTADTDSDCRVAAIEGLGSMKASDPRIFEVLVDGMENPDPGIRLASYQSLQRITGRDLGHEVGPWREMVKANASATPSDPTTTPAEASMSSENAAR